MATKGENGRNPGAAKDLQGGQGKRIKPSQILLKGRR